VEVIAEASGRLAIGMASSTTSPTRTDQLLGSSRTIRILYVRAANKRDTPATSARIRKRKARLRRLNGWTSKTNGRRAQRCKPGCSKHFKLVGRLGSRYNKGQMLREAAKSGADAEGSSHIRRRMLREAARQSIRKGAAPLNRIEIRLYTAMGV